MYPFILLEKYIANYCSQIIPIRSTVGWDGRLWDSSICFIIFVLLEIFLMDICFEYVINNMFVIQVILESLNVIHKYAF